MGLSTSGAMAMRDGSDHSIDFICDAPAKTAASQHKLLSFRSTNCPIFLPNACQEATSVGRLRLDTTHRCAGLASVLLLSQQRRDGAVLKLFDGFSIFEHTTGRPARPQPHAPEDPGCTLFH
jgi:hypothetical protein